MNYCSDRYTFNSFDILIFMKLGVLFSGGKDSTLALSKVMEEHEVVCLISIISSNPESYMFHVPNIHLTELQSKAMEIPLMTKETQGVKEEELEDLRKLISEAKEKYEIEGIVTGAIESVYQSSRIQNICDELGLKCLNPLWKMDQVEILRETLEKDFETIISGVFAYKLDKDWLGKQIDEEIIQKLIRLQEKYEINPAGEGGEIETTVLDTPFFKKRIKIVDSEIEWSNDSGIFKIKKAEFASKY